MTHETVLSACYWLEPAISIFSGLAAIGVCLRVFTFSGQGRRKICYSIVAVVMMISCFVVAVESLLFMRPPSFGVTGVMVFLLVATLRSRGNVACFLRGDE